MTLPQFQLLASTVSLAQSEATPLEDLQSIVSLYEPRVFRFLIANLRDRDAAESLTQETFLRAWTNRASFRSDCSISTWLLRIALNLARDHTRTNRFRFWKKASLSAIDADEIASSLPSGKRTPEADLIAREQVASIWKTVATLSGRQRSIFLLRFVEELEIPEIAQATGLPVGTVKSHLYRALATVRANHSHTVIKKELR